MSEKPAVPPEGLPKPPANPDADWTAAEKAFFEKHGITEEKEKEAIRGRARVLAYDRMRQQYEKDHEKPKPDDKKGGSGTWYDKD